MTHIIIEDMILHYLQVYTQKTKEKKKRKEKQKSLSETKKFSKNKLRWSNPKLSDERYMHDDYHHGLVLSDMLRSSSK